MESETKTLIISVLLALVVVILIIFGLYIVNQKEVIKDPCINITGCEHFQCQADHEVLYGAISMYLLKKQNCLLFLYYFV